LRACSTVVSMPASCHGAGTNLATPKSLEAISRAKTACPQT
jgi:hypothetical protein